MAGERPVERDRALMRRALANAERGWGQTAPNPMVGAVVVSGGVVVADGWHARYGDDHAEVAALRAAGARANGSTMYVTLEPCTHFGKTPPCTDAIIAAGVARVVIGALDPSPRAGGGADVLRKAGIEVETGVERLASCELNAAFFNTFTSDRPWILLKLAVSADGGIADPTGKRRWITGLESRREVHRMRAGVDAVAVGVGTVLADDPELTVRDAPAPRRQPTRVIFDSHLRTPATSKVVVTAREVPTVFVAKEMTSGAEALEKAGAEILIAPDLPTVLARLRNTGLQSMLIEGGARLAGAVLRDKAADRITIFRAPVELGGDALQAFAHAPRGTEEWLETLPIVDRRTFGEDTLITYSVRQVPCSPA